MKEERKRRERLWSEGQGSGVKRTVSATTPPRFDSDDPALLAYLDEHGYAVVKDVLTAPEVERGGGVVFVFFSLAVHHDCRDRREINTSRAQLLTGAIASLLL